MGLNLKEFNKNIINWYEFKKESKVLLVTKNEEIEEFLKSNIDQLYNYYKDDQFLKQLFDYIVIYGYEKCEINIEELINNNLQDSGKLIIIGNNDYGINNWSKYKYEEETSIGVLGLEKDFNKKRQVCNIKSQLNTIGISNINTFYAFPNYEETELLLNENIKMDRGYIEKYNPDLNNDEIKIFDEIKVLKTIVKNNPQILEFFANSYFIEASKSKLYNDVKYISYNNVRKSKYRLITIMKENVVEKLPATEESKQHIENIKKNIEILKDKIELADYEENGKVYSNLIKNYKTLDRVLYSKYRNLDEVIEILNGLKSILEKDSIQYNEEILQHLPKGSDKYIDLLKKLHFLKDAFWDMIPKNCFKIDDKYVFFDQEWRQEYLPVEFIVYRGIINSYDLVRNINVNELYGSLGILEFIEFFEYLDSSIRQEVIDEDVYDVMYTNKHIKAVDNLINENKTYIENNQKQNEYIKKLEEQLESYKTDNANKQIYIELLEKNQRKIFRKR